MIRFHGSPISGGDKSQLAFQGKHACISFANQEALGLICELAHSFCLDNGAYTYFESGEEFPLVEFADWIEKWHRHPGFSHYFIPDIIGGTEGDNDQLRRQWQSMVSAEIYEKGYPVWHMSESLYYLGRLMDRHKGIAIGGSVGEYELDTPKWWSKISEAMGLLCGPDGRPVVRIHGLKMLSANILSQIPLSSADSTNVARHAGSDDRWRGAYVPASKKQRALAMMDRIDNHATASRWAGTVGTQTNFELYG